MHYENAVRNDYKQTHTEDQHSKETSSSNGKIKDSLTFLRISLINESGFES